MKDETNLVREPATGEPETLFEAVWRSLRRVKDLDASHMTVNIDGCEAILEGEVDSIEDRSQIERIVGDTVGVKAVSNRLRVNRGLAAPG